MGAGAPENGFWPRVVARDLRSEDRAMATTESSVENATDDRSIESDRLTRALTDAMTVREHGPAQYLVARDGDGHEEHLVDVEAGACDGADAHYRDVVCVHMVRASLHHAYRQVRNTRLVARVLAALRELGCPHDVAGCGGPTDEGQRGLPCEDCIAATPGHWVVYQRLMKGKIVESDADRGAGVVTDGGVVQERPSDDEDPAEAARDTPHGETVTLVYESARSSNEVEMEVERAHVLGTTGEFRRCDDEDRPAQHRVTVGRGGTVRSHTTRSTVLGELVEVR